MRQRDPDETAQSFTDRHPWIDGRLVDRAVSRVLAGESIVFSGPAGSGAPLYVLAVEAQVKAQRPDVWRAAQWFQDAASLSTDARMSLLETIRRGTTPVVLGLSSLPRTDAAAPIGRFAMALSRAWLDGSAHRIDVGRLSDDALIRLMREIGSADRLPLVSRARVVAWSNGVRVLAQQLHAAAVGAGPDAEAQKRAMARPHLGSALFDAYSSLLMPLSEHDQRMLAHLIENGEGTPAAEVVGSEMAMRLEAARVLSAPDADGMSHIPEPLVRVAVTMRTLGGRSEQVQDAASARDTGEPVTVPTGAPRRPEVAAIFERVMNMDFVGANDGARRILLLPSAAPRDRYLAAVAAGLSTAYAGSWTESALLFERADTLADVFPHDIHGWDELLGLWLEAYARTLSGAPLDGVCTRLTRRAVAAVNEEDDGSLLLASALSACLHAMSGNAGAAELELAVVSANAAGFDEHQWILPMVRIAVATCFAVRGEVARAEELLQISRAAAEKVPLVRWYLSVADCALEYARGSSGETPTSETADLLLRTGRGGLLLELHALFHFVTAVRTAGPDHVERLRTLSTLVDAPVSTIVRRWSGTGHARGDGDHSPFLLWSAGHWAGATSAERVAGGVELLSDREREVAALIAEGLSNRRIAERLFLSVRTVESHVYVARQKVGAATRKDLGAMVAARTAAAS